jgi:hypothetical protein
MSYQQNEGYFFARWKYFFKCCKIIILDKKFLFKNCYFSKSCIRFEDIYIYSFRTPNIIGLFLLPVHNFSVLPLAIIKPLNAELNPICHLLALLGAHHILHVGRIRVNNLGK